MSFRFWALAAVYHAALLAVCALRARGWRRRDALSQNRGDFWRSVLGDLPGTRRGGRPGTLRRLVSEAPAHSPRIVFGHGQVRFLCPPEICVLTLRY